MPKQRKGEVVAKRRTPAVAKSAVAKSTTSKASKTTSKIASKTTSKAAPKKPVTQMTVQEAGKKGGDAVKEKYGPEFYSQIGQKGGEKIQAEAKRFKQLKELGKV